MSRRHRAEKRKILPDPRYKNILVAKFINCMMMDGKKFVAERIFYETLAIIAEKLSIKDEEEILAVFLEAVASTQPAMEVRSRRVGGATYQVPVEVRAERARALAIRWILEAARSRSEKTMEERLATELLLIKKASDEGSGSGGSSALKKKDNTHRMAEANRAFAHFRW